VGQLAEHIAGAAPLAVNRNELPEELVERKRQSLSDEVRSAGKTPDLTARIIAGKLEAYYRAVVLMDQAWVRDPAVSITQLVGEVSAKTGEHVRVRRFARFHMGIA
jgi:elongation factor Ts